LIRRAQALGAACAGAGRLAAVGLCGRRQAPRRGRFGEAGAWSAAPAVSSVRISVPSETLSPVFTFSSLTVPRFAGAGTSIVALSDSSVISDVFLARRVARLDQHFDHRDVLEVPDVGNLNLD
jgi:hypothetical protein